MKINLNILNSFTNEQISILEIKSNDSSLWYRVNSDQFEVFPLKLIESTQDNIGGNDIEIRRFNDSEIRFDAKAGFAKFTCPANNHLVMAADSSEQTLNALSKYIGE